jgi:rod shape-determining protein MreC
MHKKNLQPYFILTLALLIIILAPKKAQNILRNQFIKPIIPLANLVPKHKPKDTPPKNIPIKNSSYSPIYPNSVVAKVIFRNPTNWNDFFWVKLDKNNQGRLSKNSPVLYQNTLIGIVDFVGKKEARIRLITNSNLSISVRAVRGGSQYNDLFNHLNTLLSYHCVQEDLVLKESLIHLKEKTIGTPQNLFLAKGELFGSSQPLWRSGNKVLFGRGFNTSFEDNLSLARELVTGKASNKGESLPIINPDDLLVTTGLDGIFPEGLFTARVLTVEPLQEGAYFYNLKAAPIATDLDQIDYVEIIEPLGYEKQNVSFLN